MKIKLVETENAPSRAETEALHLLKHQQQILWISVLKGIENERMVETMHNAYNKKWWK